MKKMKQLLFSICLLLSILARPLGLAGQGNGTLHLILSIDEYNEDIRKGCIEDREYLSSIFEWIAEDAGMSYRPYNVGFSPGDVYGFMDEFTCGPNDAVIFFYSGHGFREEDDNVIWPFLYYCEKNEQAGINGSLQDCGVPLDWIHQMLISKHPRMSLTIGNSCNEVPGNEQANQMAQGHKKQKTDQPGENSFSHLELLTRFKGHIIASGASPGQFSYTTDDDGSYFVNGLVDVLVEDLFIAEQPTSWASILKKTRDIVQQQKPDQRPQFLIVKDNKKLLFSEGAENFQYKPSYEQMGLEVPDISDEDEFDYEDDADNWEVDGLDDEDYGEEWESDYDE